MGTCLSITSLIPLIVPTSASYEMPLAAITRSIGDQVSASIHHPRTIFMSVHFLLLLEWCRESRYLTNG